MLAQLPSQRPELEARLLFPSGQRDALPADDHAYAVVPERPRRRVLVVGAPNLYLDGALLSFGDGVTMRRVAPAALEATRAEWSAYDAVVFDAVAPVPAPTAGRFVYFDPQGAGSPFAERATVRDPVASDVQRRHPLLQYLSLADLNIREARRLVPASDDVVVASSFGAPLIIARRRPGLALVALSFDVRRSDLPLRPMFPLLLANTLEWLDDRTSEAVSAQRTGQVARIPIAGADGTVVVRGPRGETSRAASVGGSVELALPWQGFYHLSSSGGSRVIAANLADPTESDLSRVPSLALGGRTLQPWTPPPPTRRTPWALMAVVAALALSLFEWGSHHRRWTV
jgi:hypothetical protein